MKCDFCSKEIDGKSVIKIFHYKEGDVKRHYHKKCKAKIDKINLSLNKTLNKVFNRVVNRAMKN